MTDLLLRAALLVLMVAMLPGFLRLARGPSVVDRILAFDAVVLCAAGLIIVLSRWWRSELYVELILIVTSLGFFGTVALVYFLQRSMAETGEPDEDEDGEGEADA